MLYIRCVKNYFLVILLLNLFSTSLINAQQNLYPQDYFRSPIDSPIYLSGNFCTLRNDHFHYGIDITTYEKEGLPVYASADGYVSRIKVSPYGYGKVIYIDHPNGYTSVYGHLSAFAPRFAQAVKDSQYYYEKFEIEFFPQPGTWKVKKGEMIALSGNSGGSSGPHIHFEIRDTKTEEIINPLLFGFNIEDTISPEIPKIALVEYDGEHEWLHFVADTIETTDTISLRAGTYAAAAIVNDYTTFHAIRFAPWEIEVLYNGTSIFHSYFERFAFDQAKQINAYILYNYFYQTGIRYQCLKRPAQSDLKFFGSGTGNFTIGPGSASLLTIRASDLAGHHCEKSFWIAGNETHHIDSAADNQAIIKFETTIYPKQEFTYEESGMKITGKASSVFDTCRLGFNWFGCEDCGKIEIYTDRGFLPFYKGLELSLKIPSSLLPMESKLLFFWSDGRSKPIAIGGEAQSGYLFQKIQKPGIYLMKADQVAPAIKPTNIQPKGKVKGRYINFEIKDALSGIRSYRGSLDGRFILMDYDAKNDWLTYVFDENTPSGRHLLQLEVTDKKGNKNIWKKYIMIPK